MYFCDKYFGLQGGVEEWGRAAVYVCFVRDATRVGIALGLSCNVLRVTEDMASLAPC